MLRYIAAAVIALPLNLATAAAAGTLATGPTFVATNHTLACELVNAGTKVARDAVVEAVRFGVDHTGTVVAASTPGDLDPLALREAGLNNAGAGAFFACRFSAKGRSSGLRGAALLFDQNLQLVDTSPAR